MADDIDTLGKALPREQARVRELLVAYKEIGCAGEFGGLMIEQALQRADKAVISGNLVAMIRAYKELLECE